MLSQALIAASLLIAAYQDLKRREVGDPVWIPAAIGIALALLFGNQLFSTLVKLSFVALIVVVATWYGLGTHQSGAKFARQNVIYQAGFTRTRHTADDY